MKKGSLNFMLKLVLQQIDENLLHQESFKIYQHDKSTNKTKFIKEVKNDEMFSELKSLIGDYQELVNSVYYQVFYDDEYITFDYGSHIRFLVIKREDVRKNEI
jgi:hypothetical protein